MKILKITRLETKIRGKDTEKERSEEEKLNLVRERKK